MSEWFFFTASDYTLAQRVSINRGAYSRNHGRGALYFAAERGKLARVTLLLALGQNPNRADSHGITPLQIAAWNNHCHVVHKLCRTKIDVNLADRVGHTALFKAVWRDCQECVQTLIRAGSNCDQQDDSGNTPLMLSADFGHTDSLLLLLTSGANVNQQNRYRETALFIAVLQENLPCVQHLLDFGANPNLHNFEGCTPLYLLARQSLTVTNYLILRAIVLANPDLDIKGRNMDSTSSSMARMTPLRVALLSENFIMADMLATLGADMNFLLLENVLSLKNRPYWKRHFSKLASSPRSLCDLCRMSIRSTVRSNCKHVTDLSTSGLPPSLVKYVTLSDLPSSRGAYIQSRASTLDLDFMQTQTTCNEVEWSALLRQYVHP